MKKKIILGFVFALVGFLSISHVNAASTEYIVGPSIVPGAGTVKMRSSRRSLTGSTTTAKGSNCGLYVTLHGTISQYLHPWSNRSLTIALWDYDFTGGDDKIKVYKGEFSGRELSNFYKSNDITLGNIESDNDPTAELFISYYLTKNSNDTKDKGTNDFFRYKLENK